MSGCNGDDTAAPQKLDGRTELWSTKIKIPARQKGVRLFRCITLGNGKYSWNLVK